MMASAECDRARALDAELFVQIYDTMKANKALAIWSGVSVPWSQHAIERNKRVNKLPIKCQNHSRISDISNHFEIINEKYIFGETIFAAHIISIILVLSSQSILNCRASKASTLVCVCVCVYMWYLYDCTMFVNIMGISAAKQKKNMIFGLFMCSIKVINGCRLNGNGIAIHRLLLSSIAQCFQYARLYPSKARNVVHICMYMYFAVVFAREFCFESDGHYSKTTTTTRCTRIDNVTGWCFFFAILQIACVEK